MKGKCIKHWKQSNIFANDIGLIAIGEGDNFLGFNVAIGGGLGATHGNAIWSVVPEAVNAAVNFRTLEDETSSFTEIGDFFKSYIAHKKDPHLCEF